MSTSARILAVVGTIAVLLIAFFVVQPGGKDNSKSPATSTPSSTSAGTATTAAPKPQFAKILVRGGKPVGGIKEIDLTKGDTARIEIASPDTTDEIHLHGYDLKRDLKAGGSVRFVFPADADGIYVIELEGSGTQIGKLVIQPS